MYLLSKKQIYPKIEVDFDPDVLRFYQANIWPHLSFYEITYLSDSCKINGFLITHNTRKPCLIYNRGGSGNFGAIDKSTLFLKLARYASWGYTLIASQYSGNAGSDGKDEIGGRDIHDLTILNSIFKELPLADEKNIGVIGESRGGMMTYLMLKDVNWLKCAIIASGESNQFRMRPDLKEFRKQFYNVDLDEEVEKRSAVFWADELNKSTPILLIHGTEDKHVDVQDSIEMDRLLSKFNHPHKLVLYEGEDHFLNNVKERKWEEMRQWLEKYM